MLKSDVALYDYGQMRWLDAPPDVDEARLIVTLLPPAKSRTEVRSQSGLENDSADAVPRATAGACGKRSLAEVQALIASQRQADWGAIDDA